MRIGSPENYLSIERWSLDADCVVWRVEAAASGGDGRFTARNDCVVCDASGDTLRRFADFTDYRLSVLELSLSEGGWLRCERDARGATAVHYRIGSRRATAAMEGQVTVDGEFAAGLHRDLSMLLTGQT